MNKDKLSEKEKDCLKEIVEIFRKHNLSDNELVNVIKVLGQGLAVLIAQDLGISINGQPTLDT